MYHGIHVVHVQLSGQNGFLLITLFFYKVFPILHFIPIFFSNTPSLLSVQSLLLYSTF
ncbi:hypothetical protein DsansV1_C17g0144431 [Dioscorea sansibarensis]